MYDLLVAETLARAADRRLLSVDVGANIGPMTGLLAAHSGEVCAFEPNPKITDRLRRNVAQFAGTPRFAPAGCSTSR
jgi:precorrin-6B methylase 2